MATITKVISRNWYTTAALCFTVLDEDGATLVARTAMAETPTGSGVFAAKVAAWDTAWIGSILYDDGSVYRTEAFGAAVATSAEVAAVGAAVGNVAGGITVIDTEDAILTTTSPTDAQSGVVTIYAGAAYTGTGTGIAKARTWTGDDLNDAAVTLYIIRQELYDDATDVTAWTALDTSTIVQTGTTIACSFNPDATATAALTTGLQGDGSTRYRAHIVATATKTPLWDFPLIVRRGKWA